MRIFYSALVFIGCFISFANLFAQTNPIPLGIPEASKASKSIQQKKVLILPFENELQHSFLTDQSVDLYQYLSSHLSHRKEYQFVDPMLFAETFVRLVEQSKNSEPILVFDQLEKNNAFSVRSFDYILVGSFLKINQTYDIHIFLYNRLTRTMDPTLSFRFHHIPEHAFHIAQEKITLQLLKLVGEDYSNPSNPSIPLTIVQLKNQYQIGNLQSYYDTLEGYKKLYKIESTNPDILGGMAKILARLGQQWRMWDKNKSEMFLNIAFGYAYNSLNADKTQLDAHIAMILLYRIRQVEKTMKEHLALAESAHPNNFELLLLAGEIYQGIFFQEGSDPKRSLDYLNRCVALNPKSLPARLALAGTLKKLGYTEDSIALLKQLLQEYPYEAMIYNNLAGIYYDKSDLCTAEEYYQKGLTYDPKNIYIQFNLAVAYTNNKKFEQGLLLWKQLIDHPAEIPSILQMAQHQVQQIETILHP